MKQESSSKINHICVICSGIIIYVKGIGRPSRQTCSKKCRTLLKKQINDSKRVDISCIICGKIKRIPKTKTIITCSKKCHAKHLSQKYKGRKLTDEWKKNQNAAKVAEKIRREGDYLCGKCGVMFKSNTSLRSHHATCHAHTVFGDYSCDKCNAILKSTRALKHHTTLVHGDPFTHQLLIERFREIARNRHNQSRSNSERIFFEELRSFIPDAVSSMKFDGCAHEFDVFIKSLNLIIEFDGDYWHGNKKTQIRTPRMIRQRMIDKSYSEKIIELGYRIIRVWDSESVGFLKEMKEAVYVGNEVLEDFINQKEWKKRSI